LHLSILPHRRLTYTATLQDERPLRPVNERPAKKAKKPLYMKSDSIAIQCWGEGGSNSDDSDDDGSDGEVVYTGLVKEDGVFSHSKRCFIYTVQYFEAVTNDLGGCYKLWGRKKQYVLVDETDILGKISWDQCGAACKYHMGDDQWDTHQRVLDDRQ
jgi:hypothetical protein